MTKHHRSFGKQVSDQAIIGERGVTMIARIVLDMGCSWHPSNQRMEVGIDGEIELVNPVTREATNAVIRVQSKATMRAFAAETQEGFEFTCDSRDLAYWLSGNSPVILVVSRPHTEEAYWVSIKDYFGTATARKERKISFDKRTMRFEADALPQLLKLGLPRSSGIYSAPTPRLETLYTNLLPVTRMPERLWLAETTMLSRREVFGHLGQGGHETAEFVLRNRRILGAHDLTEPRWRAAVDRGTVEEFPASEWGNADDSEKQKTFVELLNHCLTARAKQIGVFRRRDDDALFFACTEDGSARRVPFRSVKEATERTVFQAYPYKAGEKVGKIAYYRHSACHAQFYRYSGQWYLGVVPTYHYTSDGRRRHPLSQEYLSGMKRQEKQGAVLYQLVMWASLLRGGDQGEQDGNMPSKYPFLGFGMLEPLALPVGIDDRAWLPNEDKEIGQAGEDTLGDLPLFSSLNPGAAEPEPRGPTL